MALPLSSSEVAFPDSASLICSFELCTLVIAKLHAPQSSRAPGGPGGAATLWSTVSQARDSVWKLIRNYVGAAAVKSPLKHVPKSRTCISSMISTLFSPWFMPPNIHNFLPSRIDALWPDRGDGATPFVSSSCHLFVSRGRKWII